jgi:hypothetical protein
VISSRALALQASPPPHQDNAAQQSSMPRSPPLEFVSPRGREPLEANRSSSGNRGPNTSSRYGPRSGTGPLAVPTPGAHPHCRSCELRRRSGSGAPICGLRPRLPARVVRTGSTSPSTPPRARRLRRRERTSGKGAVDSTSTRTQRTRSSTSRSDTRTGRRPPGRTSRICSTGRSAARSSCRSCRRRPTTKHGRETRGA